jgi:hypothetical protein
MPSCHAADCRYLDQAVSANRSLSSGDEQKIALMGYLEIMLRIAQGLKCKFHKKICFTRHN